MGDLFKANQVHTTPTSGLGAHNRKSPRPYPSLTYITWAKVGQSLYTVILVCWRVPRFARASAQPLASRYTWCTWTSHPRSNRFLQSQIRGNMLVRSFMFLFVIQCKTTFESSSNWRNFTPLFQASIRPCLTTANLARLFDAISNRVENPVSHRPWWSRKTPPAPANPRLSKALPSVFSLQKGNGGGLPFDKLRDPDRGLFGGPGQEMKFNGRLDRGKD